MNPVRKQRLYFVLFIVLFSSVAIGLMAYVLRNNIDLFYPPTKLAAGLAPINVTIRGGGCVVVGSVERSRTNLDVAFDITDGAATVPVLYSGILPDLFAEGEAAVVTGTMDEEGVFNATQVLAKHDEEYVPVEVAEAMIEAGGQHQETCEI